MSRHKGKTEAEIRLVLAEMERRAGRKPEEEVRLGVTAPFEQWIADIGERP
jgi:hypothetical protein